MVSITKDACIELLNEPDKNIPRCAQTFIYFIFLVAKIAIATAWKSLVVDIALLKRKPALDYGPQKDAKCLKG